MSYDYLTGMAILALTYEKAEELRMAQGSDDPELLTTYQGVKIKRMASRTGHGGISKRWMK